MATARPTVKELLEILSDRVDWYELGIELDIPPGTLNAMREDHGKVRHRLMAMLEKWLSKYPEKGWNDIVIALKKMDKNDVAVEVEEKYCRGVSPAAKSPHTVQGGGVQPATHGQQLDYRNILDKKPMQPDLLEQLAEIKDKWSSMGTMLGVDASEIRSLRHSNLSDEDKLATTLECWIDTGDPSVTWRTIIEVLRGQFVKQPRVADKIQKSLSTPKLYNKYAHQQ